MSIYKNQILVHFLLLILPMSVMSSELEVVESQMAAGSGSNSTPNRITPFGTIHFNFNMDDFMMGFGLGTYDNEWDWSATLSYDFRLVRKLVLIPKEGKKDTYYQVNERLHRLVLNAHKDLPIIPAGFLRIGPYAGIAGGLVWNSYKGLTGGDAGFDFMPGGGIMAEIKDKTIVRAGYEYWNTNADNIMPHRITITLSVKIY